MRQLCGVVLALGAAALAAARCDLPVVKALKGLNRPAVLESRLSLSPLTPLPGQLLVPNRPEHLVAEQGGHFNASSLPLAELLAAGRLIFQTHNWGRTLPLTADWPASAFGLNLSSSQALLPGMPVVSVGSHGSGLPFHQHSEAWLTLLAGRKLWVLGPPDSETPPQLGSAVSPSQMPDGMIRCEQQPGQTLFLPEGTGPTQFSLTVRGGRLVAWNL